MLDGWSWMEGERCVAERNTRRATYRSTLSDAMICKMAATMPSWAPIYDSESGIQVTVNARTWCSTHLANLEFACFLDIGISIVGGGEEIRECLEVHRWHRKETKRKAARNHRSTRR